MARKCGYGIKDNSSFTIKNVHPIYILQTHKRGRPN